MSPQLAEALQKHLEKHGKSSRFLFTNSAGVPVDYSNFSKKWRKVQADLGITPPRSPHNTRHTFATLMISRGENIAFVSKILGHSSIKVTVDTYFKWIPRANRIAVEALDFTGQLPAQNANGNWVKVTQRIPVRIAIGTAPAHPLIAGMSVHVRIDTGK